MLCNRASNGYYLQKNKKYLLMIYITMICVIFNRIKRGQYDRIWMIIKLMLKNG